MTKLPAKELLDGSKVPKTTTGEMKDALGKLYDYLDDLLGEDSADKEAARLALGIDLAELDRKINAKADPDSIKTAIRDKADKAELENKANRETVEALREEIVRKAVPIGSIHYFAMAEPPAGYLKADGSAARRETYPELFAAIGTLYGEGDGETTFNLPDLIGRFAEGSATPGTVKEAGLPDAGGFTGMRGTQGTGNQPDGIFYKDGISRKLGQYNGDITDTNGLSAKLSLANAIYGNSDTVQPPALTLLPCIKAFDGAVDTGLVDVTALAQEVTNKTDKNTAAHAAMPSDTYVDLTFSHGASYTAPSDGWVYLCGRASTYPVELYAYSSNGVELITNSARGFTETGVYSGASIPIRKGQTFKSYYYNGTVTGFRFVYAEGSQP